MADSQCIKLCECGCGCPAPIATQTRRKFGYIKGQPARYLRGHYRRPPVTLDDVLARCKRVGECLVWQGALGRDGYAYGTLHGRKGLMHRLVWEHDNGPIPPGYTIDHVRARGCRYVACCNVAHMEVVTPAENVARGTSPSSVNRAKTHCPQGHPLSGDNLSRAGLRLGRRSCRECRRVASYAAWQRRCPQEGKRRRNRVVPQFVAAHEKK